MTQEVILTGLRANADMHLGNYLGAIKPMVELQRKIKDDISYQLNMFVPDLHSFTTPIEHDSLYQNTLENIRQFVAAGLDLEHERTYVYRQSYIPAHSEMTWILSCFTYIGELNRMTQYKDKAENQETASAGLFLYPVLMAADILLYGAHWVPVGDDQRQHLELTRDLGQRINNRFGKEILKLPYEWDKQLKFSSRSDGVRIRSLRHPEQKMSKSVDDPAGTILLTDTPDDAAQKIMSATTDSLRSIKYDWQTQPGVSNLIQILALLRDETITDCAEQWQGKANYGELKTAVADTVRDWLSEYQQKLGDVNNDQIKRKLEMSEEAMSEIANGTLKRIQSAVGLRPNA